MTLRSFTQTVKLSNNFHIHTNEKKVRVKCCFFLQKYVTTYQTNSEKQKIKKIPCRNYKVTTCIYVTPPKFHFYSKKPTISVFTFMLLNIR